MLTRTVFLLFMFASNVSYAGLFGDDEAREQISVLNNQAMDMDARIVKMEKMLESQALLGLYAQVETLELELGKLRGQIEVLENDNKSLQKRQKDFYIDLDSRLRRIEQPGMPVDSTSTSPASSANSTASLLGAKSHSTSIKNLLPAGPVENNAYEAAYSSFRNGDYSGAISQFEVFLHSYPKSSLAPSAAYWVGNAHYALRNFNDAINAQKKLISMYPDSIKVPDALLNIASSQQETLGGKAAKATLKDLVARYPFSDAAGKAKRRLAKIK